MSLRKEIEQNYKYILFVKHCC